MGHQDSADNVDVSDIVRTKQGGGWGSSVSLAGQVGHGFPGEFLLSTTRVSAHRRDTFPKALYIKEA